MYGFDINVWDVVTVRVENRTLQAGTRLMKLEFLNRAGDIVGFASVYGDHQLGETGPIALRFKES